MEDVIPELAARAKKGSDLPAGKRSLEQDAA
jgi:hypothetical protein